MSLQRAIAAIYPPQCITCHALVATDFGLCPDCWRDTPFVSGLVCGKCGTPLPGDPDRRRGDLRRLPADRAPLVAGPGGAAV
jgi:predicted amidophosphoribosyltransferase